MRISSIRLHDFRSFQEKEIQPSGVTILVGPNASGKTNLIEAVQIATTARSFHNPAWEEVVRWGAEEARIEISAVGDSTQVDISTTIPREGPRAYRVNGKQRRRVSDVVGLIPAVTFTPDDLRLVKDSGERRRAALDDVGEQLWPTYGKVRRDYARVLRQRNLLLRGGAPARELAPWTEQVVAHGGQLLALRTRLLSRMREDLESTYKGIAGGESCEVAYADKQGLDTSDRLEGVEPAAAREAISRTLEVREAEERARRTTLAGPHRDDIVFSVAGRPARAYASQGQQRSITLAWKIAVLHILETVLRRRPVLLLDDVMSELDEDRRVALTGLVGAGIQTFITTTNLGYFAAETLSGAEVVELP